MKEAVQQEKFDSLRLLIDENAELGGRDCQYLILDETNSGWALGDHGISRASSVHV